MTGRHIALMVFASLLATTESALSETPCTDTSTTCADEGIAPKAKRVTLVSWDTTGTGALTYDVNGALFTAYVTTQTKVRHAPIVKYTPPDPVIPLVEDWNAAIADGAKVFGSLEPGSGGDVGITNNSDRMASFATLGAHFRVKLSGTIVTGLRPVP